MEDLGTGGRHPTFYSGLNKAQVENLIEVIAKVHALSLSIPDSRAGLTRLKFTSCLDQEDGQTKNSVIENLLRLPHDYFRKNRDALLHLASKTEIMQFGVYEHFGTPPVLCHGDFWLNNFFMRFKKESGQNGTANGESEGPPPLSDDVYALVDLQFSHPSKC